MSAQAKVLAAPAARQAGLVGCTVASPGDREPRHVALPRELAPPLHESFIVTVDEGGTMRIENAQGAPLSQALLEGVVRHLAPLQLPAGRYLLARAGH